MEEVLAPSLFLRPGGAWLESSHWTERSSTWTNNNVSCAVCLVPASQEMRTEPLIIIITMDSVQVLTLDLF